MRGIFSTSRHGQMAKGGMREGVAAGGPWVRRRPSPRMRIWEETQILNEAQVWNEAQRCKVPMMWRDNIRGMLPQHQGKRNPECTANTFSCSGHSSECPHTFFSSPSAAECTPTFGTHAMLALLRATTPPCAQVPSPCATGRRVRRLRLGPCFGDSVYIYRECLLSWKVCCLASAMSPYHSHIWESLRIPLVNSTVLEGLRLAHHKTESPQPKTQSPQPETQPPQPLTQPPQPQTQSPQSKTQSPQPKTQSPQPPTQSPQDSVNAAPDSATTASG
eukprot:gene17931-biopygen8110